MRIERYVTLPAVVGLVVLFLAATRGGGGATSTSGEPRVDIDQLSASQGPVAPPIDKDVGGPDAEWHWATAEDHDWLGTWVRGQAMRMDALRVGADATFHQRPTKDPAQGGWFHLPTSNYYSTDPLSRVDQNILIDTEDVLTSYLDHAVAEVDATGNYVVLAVFSPASYAYAKQMQSEYDSAMSFGQTPPHRGVVLCFAGSARRPFTYGEVRDSVAQGGSGFVEVARYLNQAEALAMVAALNN